MPKLSTFRLMLALLMTLVSVNAISQGITVPRTPSPAAVVSQTIGISAVTSLNPDRPGFSTK